MANGIRTGDPCGFNEGRSSKFREGSRVRQTPEEGRKTYRPKRYGNNNKDEDNSPKTLNDKNQQASSQKFRQQFSVYNQLNVKTIPFQAIQFCAVAQFSSIWPIDRTLLGTTTQDQSGPGSDDNKGILCIPKALALLKPHYQVV